MQWSDDQYNALLGVARSYRNELERLQAKYREQERKIGDVKRVLTEKLCAFLDENEDENGKIDKGIFLIDVIGVETQDGEVITKGIINEVFEK